MQRNIPAAVGRDVTGPPPPEHHDHQACIQDALAAAARLCADRGALLTPLRRRVLELVWADHQAVKAYDLMNMLGTGGKPAKPPTVYRALDFLIEHGLVHKVESLNAYVGCPHPSSPHQGLFLICTECGRVDELSDRGIRSAIDANARTAEFAVQSLTLEVRGRCAFCRPQ